MCIRDRSGAVQTVKLLLAQSGGLGVTTEEALNRTAETGTVHADDESVLVAAVYAASSTAARDALLPGAGGLLQAGVAEAQLAPLAELLPKEPRRTNPFGHLAGLRISKKSYDRAKARRFRKDWRRWLPLLSPILQKRGYSVQSAGCAMTPVQRNRTNAGLI